LDVVAVDVSPVAIDLLRAAAARDGCSGRVDARVHDLDTGLPADIMGVDVVVCQRFRNRERYADLVAVLATGGLGFVTVLSVVGLDGEAGPFHACAGELAAAFDAPGLDVLGAAEGDGVASIVFRRC
jgi:hypothetical protein